MTGARICPGCDRPLQRKPRESPHAFRNRSHCNYACWMSARRKTCWSGFSDRGGKPTKICDRDGCGAPYHPHRNEGPKKFSARRFCSPDCVQQHAKLTMKVPERVPRAREECGPLVVSWPRYEDDPAAFAQSAGILVSIKQPDVRTKAVTRRPVE